MRRASALVAVSLLAAGVAGCGSSSTSATADSGVVLIGAYTQTVAAKTAAVTFSVKEETAGKTIQATGSGAFDWGTNEGEVTSSVHVPGATPAPAQTFSFQEVVADGFVYLKFPAQDDKALKLTTPWAKLPLAGTSAFSPNPAQTLQLLISEASNVTKVGTATVDGVATTEYKADVDPAAAAARLPASEQAEFSKAAAETGLRTVPIEAYVDSAGRAVRLIATIDLTVPAGPNTGGSPQGVTTVEQFDFSKFGDPVTVTVPPAGEVGTSGVLSTGI